MAGGIRRCQRKRLQLRLRLMALRMPLMMSPRVSLGLDGPLDDEDMLDMPAAADSSSASCSR